MAARSSGAVMGPADVAPFLDLFRRMKRLEAAVAELQTRGDQMLPADFRYEYVTFGGQRAVVIRRVSTDLSDQITVPL